MLKYKIPKDIWQWNGLMHMYMQIKKNHSEKELLYNNVFEKYREEIYNFCSYYLDYNESLVQDCVQDIFMSFYQAIDDIENHDNLRGWLYKASKIHVKRYIKKITITNKHLTSLEDKYEDKSLAKDDLRLDSVFEPDICIPKILPLIFKQLNERELALYQLFYKSGLTIEDIAEKLHISQTNVTTRVYRLKLKIKKLVCDLISDYH